MEWKGEGRAAGYRLPSGPGTRLSPPWLSRSAGVNPLSRSKPDTAQLAMDDGGSVTFSMRDDESCAAGGARERGVVCAS